MGSRAKWRGVSPRVDWCPSAVSMRLFGSIAKMAMLSWPRLEPYRKRPSELTSTSAVLFFPE